MPHYIVFQNSPQIIKYFNKYKNTMATEHLIYFSWKGYSTAPAQHVHMYVGELRSVEVEVPLILQYLHIYLLIFVDFSVFPFQPGAQIQIRFCSPSSCNGCSPFEVRRKALNLIYLRSWLEGRLVVVENE